MTAALHLAGPEDLERILPMVGAYHGDEGIDLAEGQRRAALQPLLEGSPHGAVWMIGPRRAPVGYVVVSFGWSVEFGGLDGFIDEIYIRQSVRGRGMGTEVVTRLLEDLSKAGVKALHLEVAADNASARRLYQHRGFEYRDGYHLMSWRA